jgi:quinol monooxygenase YgiN
MYAQVTYLQVPMNYMSRLRRLIETDYLPVVSMRPGFKAGYLLEQEDDPDTAQLVLLWEDQASVERFNRTGMLQASIQALAAEMPDLRVRRQGYVVRVTSAEPMLAGVG